MCEYAYALNTHKYPVLCDTCVLFHFMDMDD